MQKFGREIEPQHILQQVISLANDPDVKVDALNVSITLTNKKTGDIKIPTYFTGNRITCIGMAHNTLMTLEYEHKKVNGWL